MTAAIPSAELPRSEAIILDSPINFGEFGGGSTDVEGKALPTVIFYSKPAHRRVPGRKRRVMATANRRDLECPTVSDAADGAEAEPSGGGQRHVPVLDLIRFAAAAMVMLFHLAFLSWAGPTSTPGGIAAGRVAFPEFSAAYVGWVGPEIFFVISGFVIAYSAESATAFSFFRSRVLRLVPAVWICAPLTALALFSVGMFPGWRVLGTTAAFFPSGPWVDGVYWTLAVEIAFYSLVLLTLWLGQFRHIAWLAGLLIAWNSAQAVFSILPLDRHSDLLLANHGAFFGLGVFLWIATVKGRPKLGAIGALSALPACFWGIWQATLHSLPASGASVWGPISVWTICVALIPLAWRFKTGPRATAFARRIGLMTYPLYLIHDAAGAVLIRKGVDAGLEPKVALLLAIAAALGTAWIVVDLEQPLRRALAATLELGRRAVRAAMRRVRPDQLVEPASP